MDSTTSIDQPPLKKPSSIEQKTLDDDLISNLPDAVLSLIISKLPTKYAVGTSILSTRWKHLFSSIPDPSLDFDDSLFLHPSQDKNSYSDEPITCFVDFVHRVMHIIFKDVPTITTFRLKCQRDYDDYQIIDWVCAALARGLVWAQFIFDLNDPSLLFHTLSGCTTLIYLELENSIIDAPPSFSLPNLKYLVIQRSSLCSDQALFSGCPVLQHLIMRYTSFGEIQTLDISIPSLKSLIMEYCYSLEVPHKLLLDTPELDLLFYQCNVAKEYTVKNLNTLLKARMHFGNSKHLWEGDFSQYDQNVADLVTGCSSVESLFISKSSLTFFYNSGRPLPMFRNLKHLQLGGFDTAGWELLPEILGSAPNLEFLDITEDFYEEKGCYERFLSNLPVDVPVCLSSHLKKIEIWAFKGEEDEFKLVEYLLKNAKVLNKIKISCEVSMEKYFSTIEKLFNLKSISISKTCGIWISGNE